MIFVYFICEVFWLGAMFQMESFDDGLYCNFMAFVCLVGVWLS